VRGKDPEAKNLSAFEYNRQEISLMLYILHTGMSCSKYDPPSLSLPFPVKNQRCITPRNNLWHKWRCPWRHGKIVNSIADG